MEKLTHAQLLSRLSQFSRAQYEAAAIDDQEFAQECGDVVSVITEALESRTVLAAMTGATFLDIPMMPRTCVTSAAISILTAARKSGARAFLATTEARGREVVRTQGVDRTWLARIGDMKTLSGAKVIVVDDAELMEKTFSQMYPRSTGLRAHLAELVGVRVYWLTSEN